MTISKDRISSPLEAGQSILDSQKLPVQLLNALDYVSGKLIRKHLHLTLIVVPNDVQLPGSPNSPSSPSSMHNNVGGTRSPSPPTLPGSPPPLHSTAYSPPPSLPKSVSPANSTESSPSSSPSLPIAHPPNPYNLTLLHASSLSPKATKYLHETVTKASKKFSLGSGWLTTPSSPISSLSNLTTTNNDSPSPSPATGTGSATTNLIRRSLIQNDVVFSNEGLTLLSLDRVYTAKLALSTYSRVLAQSQTHSLYHSSPSSSTFAAASQEQQALKHQEHQSLTSAVNALRLLISTHNGKKVSKSLLLRSYDHLSVSNAALMAVNTAYVRRFNFNHHGEEVITGLEAKTTLETMYLSREVGAGVRQGTGGITVDVTARSPTGSFASNGEYKIERIGPITPIKSEDVTPVTRGEWGFLMGGVAGQGIASLGMGMGMNGSGRGAAAPGLGQVGVVESC